MKAKGFIEARIISVNYNGVIRANKPNVDLAEKMLLASPKDHVECPTYNHFMPGVYIREMHIPKGTLIIGHEHIVESTNVFLKGKLKLLQEDGTWQELEAPMMFKGKLGRKVAIALEDCVWQNIFATEEKDLQVLENTLIRKSQAFLEREKCLLAQ